MKKLLFIFGTFLSMSTYAQTNAFESNVKVRFDAGIDNYKNHSLGAEYIGGYRFSSKTKIGVGTGISWVNQLYKEHSILGSKDYNEDAIFIPVFINGKVNFIESGISPFFNMNVGYSIFVPCSEYAKNNHLSFFANPSLGIDIPLSSGALTFEIGYKYQMRHVDNNALSNMGDCNYSQFEASFGFQF